MANTTNMMPARWKFWESYSNALEVLAATDEEKAKDFLWAVYRYSSWGEVPEFNDANLAMSWELIKPNLDNSVKAHASGATGKKKAEANKRKKSALNDEERKSVRRMTKAMGKLYEDHGAAGYDDIDPNELWG
jgi:hypothetical protein